MTDSTPMTEESKIRSRQLQRIREYQTDTLERKDPLAACVGTINAQMMQISVRLGSAIMEELEEEGGIVDTVQVLEKPIEMYQRLTRQVERYLRVERQDAPGTKFNESQSGVSKFRKEEPHFPRSENLTD